MRTFLLAGLADRLPFRTVGDAAHPASVPVPLPRGAEPIALAMEVDAASVAAGAGCLLMVLEADGRIAFFNRRCEEISGFASTEAVGRRPWELFIAPEEVDVYQRTYRRLRNTPLPDGYETWWRHRDGGRRLIRWTNASLAADDDAPILVTGVEASPLRSETAG
jgi:PAS domain S-box-containing protein